MSLFVNRISADRWSGRSCVQDEFDPPVTEDVEKVVEELDTKVRTLACFYGSDGSYLTIGGGAGQYVVILATPGGEYWNLVAKGQDPEERVPLVCGGQEGDFPKRQVVDKDSALKAAKSFSLSGELDQSLKWELDI